MRTVLVTADLHHPAVDAALGAAIAALGMQAVYVGGLNGEHFAFERFAGDWPEPVEAALTARSDSMCHRMLAGAPPVTSDAAHEPAYADCPARERLGITSYVAVPLHTGLADIDATICGIDRRSVPVGEPGVAAIRALARVLEAFLQPAPDVVVRRTDRGWRVGGDDEPDLLSAMVLADLLAPAGNARPPAPPAQRSGEPSETERLALTVRQLEHALGSRVAIEQAIGVLAERQRLAPRTAFERLRRSARSRGRRVVDLAREVVASTEDRAVPLPPDLAGPR